jgi:hypothetical protein
MSLSIHPRNYTSALTVRVKLSQEDHQRYGQHEGHITGAHRHRCNRCQRRSAGIIRCLTVARERRDCRLRLLHPVHHGLLPGGVSFGPLQGDLRRRMCRRCPEVPEAPVAVSIGSLWSTFRYMPLCWHSVGSVLSSSSELCVFLCAFLCFGLRLFATTSSTTFFFQCCSK